MTPFLFYFVALTTGLILTVIGTLNIINYWIDSDDIPVSEVWKYRLIFLGNIVVFLIGLGSFIFSSYLMYRSRNELFQNNITDLIETNSSSKLPIPEEMLNFPIDNQDIQLQEVMENFRVRHQTVVEYQKYVSLNTNSTTWLYDKVYENLEKYLNTSEPQDKIEEIEQIKNYNLQARDLEQKAKQNVITSEKILKFIDSLSNKANSMTISAESEKMEYLINANRELVMESGPLVKSSQNALNTINEYISRKISR